MECNSCESHMFDITSNCVTVAFDINKDNDWWRELSRVKDFSKSLLSLVFTVNKFDSLFYRFHSLASIADCYNCWPSQVLASYPFYCSWHRCSIHHRLPVAIFTLKMFAHLKGI